MGDSVELEESPNEDDQQNGLEKIHTSFSETLGELGNYLRLTGASKILRRYFAMNAFDGSMTSLGVVMGAWVSHIKDPTNIIWVIVTSGVAMMVSGFSGTYMTESAERAKSLNELEDAMLVDLDKTVYGQASRFVSLFAALVDGTAPFMASIPSLIPFILVPNALQISHAFLISIGAALVTLFILGVYLGRISEKNLLTSGLKMVVSGIAVALIALVLDVKG
jgi:predicted membrane protein (TIGR00267 family)